jgi:hypothetical protein
VGSDGKWSLTPTASQAASLTDPGGWIKAVQVDPATGAVSPAKGQLVTPGLASFDGVTAWGEAGSGDTVTVRDSNGKVLCTTTVDSPAGYTNTPWGCTLSTPQPIGATLRASQSNTDGWVSASVSAVVGQLQDCSVAPPGTACTFGTPSPTPSDHSCVDCTCGGCRTIYTVGPTPSPTPSGHLANTGARAGGPLAAGAALLLAGAGLLLLGIQRRGRRSARLH